MKPFAVVALFICLAAAAERSEDMKTRSAYGEVAHHPYGESGLGPQAQGGPHIHSGVQAHFGGGSSIPALPCPKNYLFSCQPSLQPAPCSQVATGHSGGSFGGGYAGGYGGGYGGAGSYSENYPVYALQVPQYVNGYQTY